MAVALALGACATEGPDGSAEVDRLGRAASEGVSTVRRALADPDLQFQDLGAGVDRVETAGRALRHIAEDGRFDAELRVAASLAEARAYDDLALSFSTPQDDLLADILDEKARPARTAARHAYVRARTLACLTDLAEPATMLEILDGVSRYVGEDAVTEPCPR